MSSIRGARRRRRRGGRAWSDLTVGPWPCDDPKCLLCQLTPEQWRDIHVRIFERAEDVYIVTKAGHLYPVELRHVTVGPKAMNEMLGLVKQDARSAVGEGRVHHSHTSDMKPR